MMNDDHEVVITTVNWSKRIALDADNNMLTIVGFMDSDGDDTTEIEEATVAIAQYTTGPFTGQWVPFATDGFEPVNGNG